ncbi:MAG: hypothetical protein SOT28_12030 [Fusicatenibacter sp.]|nr:hypothetical protein [Lachnospiraceae bacterium]MDY2939009.1 hypothetical protein [Fusicatenibacter sp.]
MAGKTGKTLLCLTFAAAAVGGALTYFKMKEKRNDLDEDFDDFTDEFEAEDENTPKRTYTTLPKNAANHVRETAEDMKETAKEIFHEVKDAAQEIGKELKDSADEIVSEFQADPENQTEE